MGQKASSGLIEVVIIPFPTEGLSVHNKAAKVFGLFCFLRTNVFSGNSAWESQKNTFCSFLGLFVVVVGCLFVCLFICLFVWMLVCLFVLSCDKNLNSPKKRNIRQ